MDKDDLLVLMGPGPGGRPGHRPLKAGSRGNVHDTCAIDAILGEQRAKLPQRVLIALLVMVRVQPQIRPYVKVLESWVAGRIRLADLTGEYEAIRARATPQAPNILTP